MKQVLSIACAFLVCVAPMAVQAQIASVTAKVAGQASAVLLAQNDGRRGRFEDRREDDRAHTQERQQERAENRRDDRLNRAVAIAQSRGRVIDAGQENGAIFWVRVATERGRVDYLVDTNTGRIIGER